MCIALFESAWRNVEERGDKVGGRLTEAGGESARVFERRRGGGADAQLAIEMRNVVSAKRTTSMRARGGNFRALCSNLSVARTLMIVRSRSRPLDNHRRRRRFRATHESSDNREARARARARSRFKHHSAVVAVARFRP